MGERQDFILNGERVWGYSYQEDGKTYYRHEADLRIHGVHVGEPFGTRTSHRLITTDEQNTQGTAFIFGKERPVHRIDKRLWETVESEEEMDQEEKVDFLRSWLRYHGDYHIVIDLWSCYGTVELTISHHNTILAQFRGKSFEKRLNQVIAYIKTIDDEE